MSDTAGFLNDPLFRPILESVDFDGVDLCHIKLYHKNEFLCHKGHEVKTCHFIMSGDLSVFNEFDNGKTYNFETISKGLIIGEMEIAANSPIFSASVVANSTTKVIEISTELYKRWSQHAEFIKQSQHRLANMLCSISSTHGENLVYNSKQLMLRFLIRGYEEHLRPTYICLDTRESIAEKTGLSLRSVNRAIKNLVDENLITIHQGKVKVDQNQYYLMKQTL